MTKKLIGLYNLHGIKKEDIPQAAEAIYKDLEKKIHGEPPYTVVIIDLLDAYHYADVFDDERYAIVGKNFSSYTGCVKLADRLFKALNYGKKTQTEWIEWEDGWDVRIYDSNYKCVYRAYEKLPE